MDVLEYEVKALNDIDEHQNVMKFIDYGEKEYIKKSGVVRHNVKVFVFELVSGG